MNKNEILTDDSLMPTGKYKGDKMETVQAWYLLWLYDQNMCPQNVKDYIDDNRQVLEKQNDDESKYKHKKY